MSHRYSPFVRRAALSLVAFGIMAAPARSESGEGTRILNCFSTFYGFYSDSCIETFHSGRINPHVIQVPASTDPAAAARDRRWSERCRPVVLQDSFGMPRYRYDAPGCEYGRLD